MKKQDRAAIEAVARHFCATWEAADGTAGPAAAYLRVGGKRIAVEVAARKQRSAATHITAKPGLRFDRVATRLINRLQETLCDAVPDGATVLVTVTAPIRLASKTAAALEDRVRALLGGRLPGRDVKGTIHGNRVQVRLLKTDPGRAPRVIGFVHNPDSDPLRLFNMTREMLELTAAGAGGRAASQPGERWLVATSASGSASLEAYRYMLAQLRPPARRFGKILMVFGDGHVGTLAGPGGNRG